MAAEFLSGNPENADLNQYWYSTNTIAKMIDDISLENGRIAFLSTPSLYFALPEDRRSASYCFDFDKQWDNDRGFVFYDFNQPLVVPEELKKTCTMVVIDPPFITRDVWEKYAQTVKELLVDGGKVLCTTVNENAEMMNELFKAKPTKFLPSIPNLVYQYNLYTNYDSEVFSKENPEIY